MSRLLLGTCLGAALGGVCGIRWIACLGAAGGSTGVLGTILQRDWLECGLVGALGVGVVLRAARLNWTQWGVVGVSALIGSGCYMLLVLLERALDAAFPGSASWVAAVLLGLALIAGLLKRRRPCCELALLGAGLLPWTHDIARVSGDGVALQAIAYAPPPSLAYHLSLALSVGLLGAAVGCVASWLTGTTEATGLAWGALVGVGLAACVSTAQTTVFLVAMRSGQDPTAIMAAMVTAWAAIGLAGVSAVRAWVTAGSPAVFRFAPAAVFLLAGAYAYGALSGYADYRSLSSLHPDGVYVYVHVARDGSRQRTLDEAASSARSERVQLFLSRYPCSAYRPAALLLAARSQFEEWRFSDASQTLEQSKLEYPLLDGYRDILHGFASLAISRPGVLLCRVSGNDYFAKWRQTQGAQIAADAAARAGLTTRAYGLHSAYIDYLATARPTSWSTESAQFSLASMSSLRNASADGGGHMKGLVRIQVMGPSGPVRGARIILVRPHPDAALPSDSVQFTGAWTVPAWGGIWAVTDNHGLATLPKVPYGSYDLVVGLRFSTWPADTVVSRAPAGVTVSSPQADIRVITLAPAVQLLAPAQAASVDGSVRLSWAAYPNAHHYSASVIAAGEARSRGTGVQRGSTCWARGNIRATSTEMDKDHFVDAATCLHVGESYMWVVCAYASDGTFLSSSEHYFEMAQRTFTVSSNEHKGGLPR